MNIRKFLKMIAPAPYASTVMREHIGSQLPMGIGDGKREGSPLYSVNNSVTDREYVAYVKEECGI